MGVRAISTELRLSTTPTTEATFSEIPCREQAHTGPVRVFVVEDDALSAIVLNDLLELWGFEVCGMAGDAKTAIREAERYRPDFLLMDIRLAGQMDGVAAAQELRRRINVRSIFLTAHTDRATMQRVRETEPLDILAKPYSPDQLQATLNRALEQLRLG